MGALTNILRGALGTVQKALNPVLSNAGAWWPIIREPFSGAWQQNVEWSVRSVLEYPTVFSCISLIADDIGKLPPGLVKESSNGIWIRAKEPRVEQLLKRPNNYQNHIQFKQWWITSKLIRGNTYVLKRRNEQGDIVALYILNPDYVQVLVTDVTGEVYYQLGNDPLTGVPQPQVTVPASEIIHDRMNCLFHPLIGISPLFASGLAAAAGLNMQNDISNFFANGARPSGILTAPGTISQATALELKSRWDAEYTGRKSGKVAVLGDGLKFDPMRMTAVDAQFIEQLKWTDQAICSTFKVPAYKVGVGPIPSTTNVEALTQEYYTQCLQIHIEAMELCLDDGLSLADGTGVELDLDVLFRMDQKTLFEVLDRGVKAAILSPNEARKRVNLGPVKGGDSPLAQQQNFSLEALAKRDARDDPFGTGVTTVVQEDEGTDQSSSADVQSEALNGAQVTALQGIINSVATGQLPIDTARWMILAAFPFITEEEVNSMLSPLNGFTPEIEPDTTVDPDASDDGSKHMMQSIIKMLPDLLREELCFEN